MNMVCIFWQQLFNAFTFFHCLSFLNNFLFSGGVCNFPTVFT